MTSTPGNVAGTATLEGARSHARSQSTATAPTQLTMPASAAVDLPAGVGPDAVVWDETIGAGNYAGRRLRRDTVLRVTDTVGDGCVSLLVHNAHDPADRLNVADTVKVQWQAYPGEGTLLLSGMGRVLMTVVADTSGRHDALCGHSTRRRNEARYGDGRVHGPSPNARDLLALAAAKHGLERRDVATGVNLFKGVRVGDDGSLEFRGDAAPGRHVELRAEMDVVVLAANAPHPLDPRPAYCASDVRFTAWHASRPADDPWRATTPERLRAFQNTEDDLLGRVR